jgi:hypothetical protein
LTSPALARGPVGIFAAAPPEEAARKAKPTFFPRGAVGGSELGNIDLISEIEAESARWRSPLRGAEAATAEFRFMPDRLCLEIP